MVCDYVPATIEITVDTSIQGDAVPIIGNFNARAADGQTYRVLWEVATPQGGNPSTLAHGGTASGKLYFDVDPSSSPDSMVYRGAGGPLGRVDFVGADNRAAARGKLSNPSWSEA